METQEALQQFDNAMSRLTWENTPLGPRHSWSASVQTWVQLCRHAPVPMALYWGSQRNVVHNARFLELLSETMLPWQLGISADALPSPFADWLRPQLDDMSQRPTSHVMSEWKVASKVFESTLLPLMNSQQMLEGVFQIFFDVTSRVMALKAANEFLAFALENAHMGAWELVEGQANVHRTLEHDRLFGYDELLPHWDFQIFLEHVLPEDRSELSRLFAEAVAHGTPWKLEHRIRRRDGEIRWLWSSGSIREASSGMPRRITGIVQEITARRKIEQDLREAQRKLVESDQRKNSFLAILSHELRNPLTPILYALEILERATPGGPQAHKAMVMLKRQVEQLSQLTNELLDVTRITLGKVVLEKKRINLNDTVSQAFEDYRPLMEELKFHARLIMPNVPSWIDADEKRVSQVMRNLLHNATKFTPTGGDICVEVKTLPDVQQVEVSVKDSGQGIAKDVMEHLFEPFVQADVTLDRRKGGLGLGLALVKGLVEQHGGHVRAESPGKDEGTTLTVTFPLLPAEGAEKPLEQTKTMMIPRRVLIIEDNADSAEALRELLMLDGHQVEVAYDGREGIALAGIFKPDIVFCDIGLPGMDGFEVARAFASNPQLRDVRLVALSGYALPQDVQKAKEAGFFAHVAKPPRLETLESLLRNLPLPKP